jgi:hypothetical protein
MSKICAICGEFCRLKKDVKSIENIKIEQDNHGNYHFHDTNVQKEMWICSKDHHYLYDCHNTCWCGWSSEHPNQIPNVPNSIKEETRLSFERRFAKCKKCGNFFMHHDKYDICIICSIAEYN